MNFFHQRPACPFPAAAFTNENQKHQHQQQLLEKVENATSIPTATITTTACTTPSLSSSGKDDFPITHIEFDTNAAFQDSSNQHQHPHQHNPHQKQQNYQFQHPTGPLIPPLNYYEYDNDYDMELHLHEQQHENHQQESEAQSRSHPLTNSPTVLHPRSEPIQVPSRRHLQENDIQQRGTTYNYCPKPAALKEGCALEYSHDRCPSPRTVLVDEQQQEEEEDVLAQERELKSRREYNRATWRMYHRITNHRTQSQLHHRYHGHEQSKSNSSFETSSKRVVVKDEEEEEHEPAVSMWGLQDVCDDEMEPHENNVMIDSDCYRRDRSPSDDFIFTLEL